MNDGSEADSLSACIVAVRASELFSRSEVMRRLFDFLAECSLAGKAPKEIEIAIDVFGKDASFAVMQDAAVRVNIHKLRRKLDEYYATTGRGEAARLVIPRGEYRLVLKMTDSAPQEQTPVEPADASANPAPLSDSRVSRRIPWRAVSALLAILLLNVIAWVAIWPEFSPAARELDRVRANPLWKGILADALPILVVAGDYYVFGELDEHSLGVQRLIRDFEIDSRSDLDLFLAGKPSLVDRYMDVSLQYLPTSTAHMLRRLLPVLAYAEPDRVRVILASELTPSMLKSSHVVYIGLLSSLGILRELAFDASRFDIGDSYDELLDRRNGRRYVSEAASSVEQRGTYRDYGYLSTYTGGAGNHIVIIAGTRDVAAVHTAEMTTQSAALAQLVKQAGTAQNFEALYAVDALDRTNLGGRLLMAAPLSNSAAAMTTNR